MESNPYESPATAGHASDAFPSGGPTARRYIWTCVCAVLFGAPAVAAITALVYRFPIPFAGYRSGPTAMLPAAVAICVYPLFFCGAPFVVAGILGGAVGALAHRLERVDHRSERSLFRAAVLAIALVDVPIAVLLAVLDKFIGPW